MIPFSCLKGLKEDELGLLLSGSKEFDSIFNYII